MGEASINLHSLHTTSIHHNIPKGFQTSSLIKNNIHRYFRPLTIIDVELRPLLMKEQMLYRNLQRIPNASIVGVGVGSDAKILEKIVEDARREIVDKATKIIPRLTDIADSLGLDRGDTNGLAGD
jgi:hypothetical protein